MINRNKTGKKNFVLYEAGGDITRDWFVSYYDHDGKRVRVYKGINRHHTKEGRREAAAKLIDTLRQTVKPPPPNYAQIKQLYAALDKHKPAIRLKTYQTYRTKINNLKSYLNGRTITKTELREYMDYHISIRHNTTAHDTLRMLYRVFKLAGMEHLLKGIEVNKGESTPLRYFQKHQIKQLTEWMKNNDPELLLWCQFVFYCFLRPRSELRLMKVGDIMYDEQKILVRGSIAKNGKQQYVAIPDAFFPSLTRFQTCPPDQYIFPGKDAEKPIGRNTYGRRHRLMLRSLGYSSEYAVYSWKHTGAVMAVKAGIGIKQLQIQLRHHSLDQVNAYLRQLGVTDLDDLRHRFPKML